MDILHFLPDTFADTWNYNNFDTLTGGFLMADKIKMLTPLVEMDGDEMTRIIWKMIKDIL